MIVFEMPYTFLFVPLLWPLRKIKNLADWKFNPGNVILIQNKVQILHPASNLMSNISPKPLGTTLTDMIYELTITINNHDNLFISKIYIPVLKLIVLKSQSKHYLVGTIHVYWTV